jgi:hypothetical protein
MFKRIAVLFGMLVILTGIALADPMVGDLVVVNTYTTNGVILLEKVGGGYIFPTFCLEMDEALVRGTAYLIGSIDDYAILGGGGAVGGKDDLDPRTAKLYDAFLNGSLPNYDGSVADQQALQDAIWWIEEEISGSLSTKAQDFVNWSSGASGLYGVRVLNLVDGAGAPMQSVIWRTPEPGTLACLGLALLTCFGAYWKTRQ